MNLNHSYIYRILKLGLVCIVVTQAFLLVQAEDKPDLQQIYKQAQELAKNADPKLQSLAKGGEGIDKIHDILQNKEGNANHQALELGNLPSAGEKAKEEAPNSVKPKCTLDDCNVASVMSTEAMVGREVKLEEMGFRKDEEGNAEDNKGYLDKARQNAKKYESQFDTISGSYKDCKPVDHEYQYKESTECDEYFDVKFKNCPVNQVVEIDPKYTYQCTKKSQDAIKTCHDEITSITCRKSSECNNGGIILSSVKTNLQSQTYDYPNLYVGTPNWAPYYCTKDDTKYTTFEVKNLSKIKEFILTRVRFDDHLLIKVNGTKVYLGPEDDGDRLEVVDGSRQGAITTTGTNRRVCERSTNWDRHPNKDLKPLLKEGENTISITIVTAGHGNAQLWIKAVQHCCLEEDWEIKRETICDYEWTK